MKVFNIKSAAFAIAAILFMANAGASAANFTVDPNSRLGKKLTAIQPAREFRGERPFMADEIDRKVSSVSKEAQTPAPSLQFSELKYFDFLEGPGGSVWFYTAEYDYTRVDVSDTYSEDYITAYTFTIYDQTFKEVGKIHDTISLKPDETRAVSITLDPALSTTFFNNDDNVEVIVYLAVNTVIYQNRYYNKVYSIGGEKQGDNDVCICELDGRIVDVLQNGNEYYFAVVTDIVPDENDYDDFVDYVNAYANHIKIMSKERVLLEYDVNLSNIPGDTTDGIYLISKVENGNPYFIISHYEKPYFVDPTGFAQDESATPDNNLLIKVFNGSGELKSTTKIPVTVEKGEDKLAYYFFSVGSLGWKDDVVMSAPYGSETSPAFIVASDFALASNLEDEEIKSTFSLYKNDGTVAKVLAAGSDRAMKISDIAGKEPQALFVQKDEEGNYTFHFVDMWSGNEIAVFDQSNGGDPISASCDRVAVSGNDYKYAFEMTYYDEDNDGNSYIRVAWFDSKGKFERIDRINIGQDVMAAMVNLTQNVLDPYLFDNSDDKMEYAVLVKRTVGATTRNEFVVVDDNDEWLAHFTEDDGKGLPYTFTLFYDNDKGNRLMMIYNDDYKYNIDVYDLPLRKAGINDIEFNPGDSKITFDGETVRAEGYIEVFNVAGMKVAAGTDSVGMATFAKGIYIVKAGESKVKISL